jgi:hypothetical protein
MTFTVDPKVILESAQRRDAWYPYAERMPIPEADTQRTITARLLILHSMAGPSLTTLTNIYRYYKRDDIHTESTFAADMEGRMAQFMPITVRADCNADANGFATSVETQDYGYPTLPTTQWTQPQAEQLSGLASWMHLNPLCNLPLVSPSAWDGSGVGHHSQFPRWSIWTGKTCPGAARITQMHSVRARAIEIVIAALSDDIDDPIIVPPAPQPQPAPDPLIQPGDDEDMKVTEIVSCKGATFAVYDGGAAKFWIDTGTRVDHIANLWKDRSPGIYNAATGKANIRDIDHPDTIGALGPVLNANVPSAYHGGQTLVQLGWDQFGWKA